MNPQRDYLTGPGAETLSAKIAAHWEARGCEVDVRVVELKVHESVNDRSIHVVQSNLRNGLPPSLMPTGKRCEKCAQWTKQGLPVRCSKCEADPSLPVRTVAENHPPSLVGKAGS